MPSFRDAFPSKWLKAADCNPSLDLEIQSWGYEDVGTGTDVKRKPVIRFVERREGWVLNITNGNLIEALLGTDDMDKWVGARIRLVSTKVQFKDKLVDAIRVQPAPPRRPRPPTAPPASPASPARPPARPPAGPPTPPAAAVPRRTRRRSLTLRSGSSR